MDLTVLYPLLALVLWVGGIWGWLTRGWWMTYQERKQGNRWDDAEFFDWLDAQTEES